MTKDLNKMMVIGNVGRVPEMRYMPSGRPVTSFSVGATREWEDQEGQHAEVEWFNVVAWDELAEVCKKRLDEEHRVYVEGRLQTRSWEDKEGKKRFRTEVVAKEIIPLQETLSEAGA